jgi:hypothetical protein
MIRSVRTPTPPVRGNAFAEVDDVESGWRADVQVAETLLRDWRELGIVLS